VKEMLRNSERKFEKSKKRKKKIFCILDEGTAKGTVDRVVAHLPNRAAVELKTGGCPLTVNLK